MQTVSTGHLSLLHGPEYATGTVATIWRLLNYANESEKDVKYY